MYYFEYSFYAHLNLVIKPEIITLASISYWTNYFLAESTFFYVFLDCNIKQIVFQA